ncbi:hypothetical protein LSH36_637g01071 [Paralvinella palmiformis]|uniref:Right handed beta helix domain-containing protein n=1 Tax=Paralvinella palmiformis TaxID=53620 RepID=A0AAD9MVW1_9ANNE|nr:hypothetical protein LSH36_637g01071 [Paralvinella palmiformis]
MMSSSMDLVTVAPTPTAIARIVTPIVKPRPLPRQSWYVIKPNGTQVNETSCGRHEYPCNDLASVIRRAQIHDVIYIDNDGDDDYVFDMCGEVTWEGLHHIEKSLFLRGHRSKPRLKCFYKMPVDGAAGNQSVNVVASPTFTVVRHVTAANETCYVNIENVAIIDTVMSFSNCTVDMDRVAFYNSSVVSWAPCRHVHMVILNSDWYGSQICNLDDVCINNFLNNLTCDYTTLKLRADRFFQTNFIVDQPHLTSGEAQIYVADSLFTNAENETQFLGGLHLTFWSNNSRVVITNCTFRRLINPTRVQSVINIYDAAIWLKATVPLRRRLIVPTNPAIAMISDCTFFDNERGLTVVGIYKELYVVRSRFERNMAMHAGAGILILIDPRDENNTLYVTNCTFVGNVAGSYRNEYPIKEKEGAFELIGKEVLLNAKCCKGVVMMVGKGGAIRAQRGQVKFSHCVFENNRAKLLGGSIMVDIDGTIKIVHTSFSVDAHHEHALQGDIVYSDGKVTISHVTISIGRARNGLSVVRHSGNHWSLDVTNIFIECPVGYNLRATNSSAYGVHEHGLRRSFFLDQLSYFCESCPRNKYSLDHGFINYTMVFNNFSYFTLLINGSEPEPQYTGKYIHHEIECDDCPYGGHCVYGITSVANFWGYNRQNRSVKFQHCPKGYCCSTTQCPSINACVEHRYGRLCGRCMAGYSEALFSSTCVPNETCGPSWLWPLGASIGLFYYLFLLFQTDMKNFLFSEPLTSRCSSSPCCRSKKRKKKRSPFMNGNVAAAMRLAEGSDCKFLSNGGGGDQDEKRPNGAQLEQAAPPGDGGGSDARDPTKDDEFKASDSGLLIVMFYYFQDALLLHVKTVYASSESRTQQLMKSILSGLFKLQLDLFELIEEVCAMPDMAAALKLVSKAFLVPYVILIFVTTYLIYKWTWLFSARRCGESSARTGADAENDDDADDEKKSFITRLSSGFILALLFTYQKLGTTTFTLLNCVPVEDELVLFIDGTVSCYQYWQYAVMAYAVTCVVPFFIVLMVGPSLLYRGLVSLPEFFLACLCPMFFLTPWTVKRLRRRGRWREHVRARAVGRIGEGTRAVIQVLQGPFKENRYGICWAGVLIGRRLILVLLFTFVNDSLIRLLGMLLTSFAILLHHVHVQPYKDLRGNVAGTMSATALVTLASINLVRAGFEAAEYTPSGPNQFLMEVFSQIENTLLLWLPFCAMCMVTMLFLYRLIKALFRCMCAGAVQRPSGSRGSEGQEDDADNVTV